MNAVHFQGDINTSLYWNTLKGKRKLYENICILISNFMQLSNNIYHIRDHKLHLFLR